MRTIQAEIQWLERKLAFMSHPNAVWFQTKDFLGAKKYLDVNSNIDELRAEVIPVNGKFKYTVYRIKDHRSSGTVELSGMADTLPLAKKIVLKFFEKTNA